MAAAIPVLVPNDEGEPEPWELPLAAERLLRREPRRPPAKGSVMFTHRDPEQPLMYGGWFDGRRVPVVFLEAAAAEVLEYVRQDPKGPFAAVGEANHWERCGFTRDEQEAMFKLDWHAVPHLGPEAEVFVPRAARKGLLPRAPPRILAFIMAFRAVNQPCWAAMAAALRGLQRTGEDAIRTLLLGTLAECFANGRHLGVVEAQVRTGAAGRMPSHKDGATSLLHMGLTLGGRRTLHAGVHNTSNAGGEDRSVWEEEAGQCVKMVPGATYLSSPFAFEHGVEFEKASNGLPAIALQCRFAYPDDLGRHLNTQRGADVAELVAVVTELLKAACEGGRLRLPTLGEVQQGEAKVRKIQEAEVEEQERRRQKVEEERERRREEKKRKEERAMQQRTEHREAMQAWMLYGWMQQNAQPQPQPQR